MAAGIDPIYVAIPKIGFGANLTTANTATDGTGTVSTLMTAGSNGAFVEKVVVRHLGTNVQSVLRIFINNGSANSTANNNRLIREVTIPANTLTQTAASLAIDVPINIPLQAGYTLIATIGTTIAAGIALTTIYGDY
jgi:hypothetical protein